MFVLDFGDELSDSQAVQQVCDAKGSVGRTGAPAGWQHDENERRDMAYYVVHQHSMALGRIA